MTPRVKFVLLLLIFLVPTVASFIAYYFFPPTKTDNYGTLLSPVVTLPPVSLTTVDPKTPGVANSLRGKWLLLTRDSGHCAEPCRKKLYAMRQARLILGREQDRVQVVVLVDDDVPPSAELQREYTATIWVMAKSSPWLSSLPAPTGPGSGDIYAVDTLGNMFMRYVAEPDIKRMSRDLLRVLKASQIG